MASSPAATRRTAGGLSPCSTTCAEPWPGLPFERAVHSVYLYGSVAAARPSRALRPRPDPGPARPAQPRTDRATGNRAPGIAGAPPESARSISISATWTRPAIRPTAIAGAIGSSTAAAACGAKTWPATCRPCVRRKPSPWPSTATMRRCWKTMRDAWKARPRRSAAACNEAAKKLIRSSDILRGETESVWPETLEHYLALFRARHPDRRRPWNISRPCWTARSNPAAFIERLRAFSAWMQRQA